MAISNVSSTLIIYLCGLFGNEANPITILFGLIEHSEMTAEDMKGDLLAYFESCGMEKSLLQEIWVRICFDEASKMLGINSSLVKLELIILVVTWHCWLTDLSGC
ncbi:hypothetical protein KIL84_023498 [Mauremys mutica]|uniref:Uncharacterized protein n=1 Tax=Mauremys mutica TaxID=74926 RepID=A0A9D3WM37_9SAUR|nr:hypothetical protein KIL84_023498 [Mauremys mutica]